MRGVKEQIKVNREEEKKRQLEEQKNNTDHAKIIDNTTNEPLPVIEEDQSPSQQTDQRTKDQSPSTDSERPRISTSSRDSSVKSNYANLSSMGQKSFISLAKAAGLTEERPVTACSGNSFSTGRTLVPQSLRSLDSAARRSRASLRAIETPSSSYSQRAGVSESGIKLDAPLTSREMIVREDNIKKTLTPPKPKHHHTVSTAQDVDNQIITEIQKEDMRKNKKKNGKT